MVRTACSLLLIICIYANGVSGQCTTGPNCITADTNSCSALADGDYQACEGCTFYHTCQAGTITSNRQCEPGTFWSQLDVGFGMCDLSSSSCTECPAARQVLSGRRSYIDQYIHELQRELEGRVVSACNTGTSSGTRCLTADGSCAGLGYGDFQACESCTVYHSCYEGVLSANRPCPAGLVWVSEHFGIGHCDWSSTTCRPCP